MGIRARLLGRFFRLVATVQNRFQFLVLLRRIRKTKSEKRFILLQTPAHSNIGDHAIAQAQIDFIGKHFADYMFFEVNQSMHFYFLEKMRGELPSSDIIFLHGGGNFGNQYMFEEQIRRSTIEAFPDNRIIIFPQTIYYTDNEIGQREMNITKQIIEKHTNLTLIAREQTSFDIMKSYFAGPNILHMPDIVLSMNKVEPKLKRSGILMVLRADDERILKDEQHNFLDQVVRRYSDHVTYSDMHYHKNASNQAGRNEVLSYKFEQFKTAELVITDRLHGMVLAAITQTPCIAFSNYNQKVSGTYEWIKDLNYIRFIDFSNDIEKEIKSLLELKDLSNFDPTTYHKYYKQITELIHE